MISTDFLVYFCAVFLLTITMLLISKLLNPKGIKRKNLLPFESGIVPQGDTQLRWRIDYFVIAISFVIFDVEAIFIYLWSIVVLEAGWLGFFSTTFFILALLIGLVYEVKQQSFGWGLREKHALEIDKT